MAPGVGASKRLPRSLNTHPPPPCRQQINASTGGEMAPGDGTGTGAGASRRFTRSLGTHLPRPGAEQLNASSVQEMAPGDGTGVGAGAGASRQSTRSLGTHLPRPGAQQLNASSVQEMAPSDSSGAGARPSASANRGSVRSLGTQLPPHTAQQLNAASATERNVRKRTVHKFLKNYKAMSNVKPRVVIEFGMTVPVGEWSQAWITEVNIILRQNAPLACHDWRTLKREDKRELFHERIMESFDIDLHLDHVEDAVNKYLGNRLKDFRAKLHQHYLKQGDDVMARRAKPYDGVTQQNWEKLCDWFEDPDFKKKSAVNKENRARQIVNHCAGSVSFVRFKAKHGLGAIEMYRQTHFSVKRGRWVDSVSHEKHDAMVTRQTEATSDGSAPPNEDEIFVDVLGEKRGYHRGLGHGFMPPSSSSSHRSAVVEELQRNVADANRRLQEAENRNQEVERRYEELLRQVQTLQSSQVQMQAFMSQFGPGASQCAE